MDVDAATAALVGAFGSTVLTGLFALLTARAKARSDRRDRDLGRKRELYARFLYVVTEMTRGAFPEDRWKELRDELGRLQYELILVAPSLSGHVEALAFDVSVNASHDRKRGLKAFEGGEAWDEHWDPLVALMQKDLELP